MFESILMNFQVLLSTERSCIDIETKPRTYCCGGGWQEWTEKNVWGAVANFCGWVTKYVPWWVAKIF